MPTLSLPPVPLFLLLLLALVLPSALHAKLYKPSCSEHGIWDPVKQKCSCYVNWSGYSCSERACPVGPSWYDIGDDPVTGLPALHLPTPCSSAGDCDKATGVCQCRPGFEGVSCSRMICPVGNADATAAAVLRPCSGHGRCVSMKEASVTFQGKTPPMTVEWGGGLPLDKAVGNSADVLNGYYAGWDSEMIHGCACDTGFFGQNCSLKMCPFGEDFYDLTDDYGIAKHNEKIVLECKASAGYFALSFGSFVTAPIPYDAPIGLLKNLVEKLPSVKKVSLTMSSPTVCGGSTFTTTTISFDSQPGELPPFKVAPRHDFSSTESILRLASVTTLQCPKVSTATPQQSASGLHLFFLDVSTSKISFTASALGIQTAVRAMSSLSSTYGQVTADVSQAYSGTVVQSPPAPTLCSTTGAVVTTITLRGSYGNLPHFGVYHNFKIGGVDVDIKVGTNKATSTPKLCSGQGTCDFTTGTCKCLFRTGAMFNTVMNRYESSDGGVVPGVRGTHGDCSYSVVPAKRCPGGLLDESDVMSFKACFGNGVCANTTEANHVCICAEGYHGVACRQKTCPKGRAWFDQMDGRKIAHVEEVECSGKGNCQEDSGTCYCNTGFEGQACEKLSCGDVSGKRGCRSGRCEPLWYHAAQNRLDDGTPAPVSLKLVQADTVPVGGFDGKGNWPWESDMLQKCDCDGSDPHFPPVSGTWTISGVKSVGSPVLGYTGFACQRALCPYGDDPSTAGVPERQTVACGIGGGEFALTFMGEKTKNILWNANALQVQAALEALPNVLPGGVEVSIVGAGASVCNGSGGFRVTFVRVFGDVPLMSGVVTVAGTGATVGQVLTVAETTKGTTEMNECSGRGSCFTKLNVANTGVCNCFKGYGSSDGVGGRGFRRDCGFRDPEGDAGGFFT